MLVLSRKIGERVVIGGEIVLTVLEVRGRQIRIGIQAPEHVPVEREEVLLAQVRSALTGKPAAHRPRVPQGWLALREGH